MWREADLSTLESREVELRCERSLISDHISFTSVGAHATDSVKIANLHDSAVLAPALKSASNRLASSSSQLLRSLSTSIALHAPASAQPFTENTHERQSRPRKAQLSKVRDDAGETASLLSAAVQSTQQHREALSQRNARSTDGGAQRRQPRTPVEGQRREGQAGPRAPQRARRDHELGGQLVSRRKQLGGLYDADASAIASAPIEPSLSSVSAETPSSSANTRQHKRRADFMKPRASAQSSPSDSPRSSSDSRARKPSSGPRTPRPPRKPRASTPTSFSAPSPPPAPPSKVHYPSADLATLLKADLASHAAAIRAEIGHTGEEGEGEQAERLKARRELRGDYSRWTTEGQEVQSKGKGGDVVQRAAELLSSNPSVSLEGRDFLLNKVQGMLKK